MAFRRYVRCLSLLIIVFIVGVAFPADSPSSDTAATVYTYRQSKGAMVDTVFRSIASFANKTIITYQDPPNRTSRAICESNLRYSSWHFENKETAYNVNAARFGDTIRITGQKGPKTITKSQVIDSLPWYQALEFSLQPFLKNAIQTCEFWMIRPTDMNVFKMIAQRTTTDTIQVNGRPEKAIQVTLSSSGLAGRFWKATYWYRASDFCFLKSTIPQGIPGLPPLKNELLGIKRPRG
jgi:hypothetical protein